MNENKIKHLEMIQNVISRMAGNSFLLKGWSVIIISALFALSAKDSNSKFTLIAILPAISFWVLDGYFLRQERLFRRLYDVVRESDTDFNFSMDTRPYEKDVASWKGTTDSITLRWFHGCLLGIVLVVAIIALAIGAK